MKKWLCYLLLSITTLGLVRGATFLRDYSTNDVLITAGFIPDSSRIIVGEPLFLTFVVSNRAEVPFQFCRVGTEIFSFSATNELGKPARNPWLHMMDGNGFVSSVKVNSGKPFISRLFLNGWCEFDEPGDYTVTCRCKLGRCFTQTNSFDSLEQPIVTVFKLAVLPSNPERVTEIINEWGQVVETNGSLNEAAQALAEFNDPRIIPPLAALVEKDANNYFAVNALARFTNEAAAYALAVVLKSGEDYEAGVAKTAITKLHQADRIARSFLPELTNADANVRIQNARAVSWTGSELAFAPLCALLQDETNTVRYAAAEAIGRLNVPRSFAALTNLLSDSDLALNLAAARGLLMTGKPFQPEWLLSVLMQREQNRTWFDSLDMLRMYGGSNAIPTMLSCVDFDVAWSDRNWWILYEVKNCPNAPAFDDYIWETDLGGKPGYPNGTPEMWTNNLRTLQKLKSLAGPIPAIPVQPIILPPQNLKTDLPINFTPTFQENKDRVIQIQSGFFTLAAWPHRPDYTSGNTFFSISNSYSSLYQNSKRLRSLLNDAKRREELNITPEQLKQLDNLLHQFALKLCNSRVHDNKLGNFYQGLIFVDNYTVPFDDDWNDLERNYFESPLGLIRDQAKADLMNSVQAFSQNYHVGTVEFVEAAKKIFTPSQLQEILR